MTQHEGCGFDSRVLPVPAGVSRYSILPPTVRRESNSELSTGANVSVDGCFSLCVDRVIRCRLAQVVRRLHPEIAGTDCDRKWIKGSPNHYHHCLLLKGLIFSNVFYGLFPIWT